MRKDVFTKWDLVDEVMDRVPPGYKKTDLEHLLNLFLARILQALRKCDRIHLFPIGSWSWYKTKVTRRLCRGKLYDVPSKDRIRFRPSSEVTK
jgi:nucleoid DNA-binding protein